MRLVKQTKEERRRVFTKKTAQGQQIKIQNIVNTFFFAFDIQHRQSDNCNLLDGNYKALFSPTDGQKGGGVALIYRRELIVAPLFSEFHLKNFLLARLSSRSAWPVRLLAVCFPPESRKREIIAHLVRVFECLNTRYRTFGLIVFGDLNTNFTRDSRPYSCK